MNRNPSRSDWFFPIEEAPVFASVTHSGKVRDVRVPHKKALVAADTGDIVGIVGAGYKVFTNQQAVTMCYKFCLEAFPDTTPSEWTFVEGHGPGTRSWAAMDIHHRAHAMNLWGNEGGASETFTPFVRITNSYNGSRALRIDVGFLREHCSNGAIFEQEAATLGIAEGAAAAQVYNRFPAGSRKSRKGLIPVPRSETLKATLTGFTSVRAIRHHDSVPICTAERHNSRTRRSGCDTGRIISFPSRQGNTFARASDGGIPCQCAAMRRNSFSLLATSATGSCNVTAS